MNIASLLATLKAGIIRLRFVLGGSLLVIVLAVGGAYGWKAYKYRQSPEFALEKLNKALLTGKKEDLAKMVDFRTLAIDLATIIYARRPETPAMGTQDQSVTLLADAIQRLLFTVLEPLKDDKAPPPVPPETPLAPLPYNFFPQVAGKLVLQSHQENAALAGATIRYGRIEQDFPLVLLMEHRGDGWRVTRIANAGDMVRLFVQAENSLQQQRLLAWEEKNASELRRMNGQLDIRSCTAAVTRLSDQKTLLLTAQIVALNRGPHTIHNMNLVGSFTNPDVPALEEKRHINIAVRMPPGEQLIHTYNAELRLDDPGDAALAEAKSLICTISPQAMTLGSGEVLHLREKPRP